MSDTSAPTVVLVHGAFADASSWAPVVAALQAEGLRAIAPPNELRGLSTDAAYVASAVGQIDGPVLLVGHSYGGAVITVAGASAPNVVGLVYVAAYIPDEGESLQSINDRFAPTALGAALRPSGYPVAGSSDPGIELSIAPEAYREAFAAEQSAEEAAVGAATQRPAAVAAFGEPASAAAWKTLPSWAVVATQDHAIDPAAERSMAERAGAETTEIAASHTVMLAQPAAVAAVIRAAVASLGSAAGA